MKCEQAGQEDDKKKFKNGPLLGVDDSSSLFLVADLIQTSNQARPTRSAVHTRSRIFTNLCLRQNVKNINLFVRKCNADPGLDAANPLTCFITLKTLKLKLKRRMILM